ncbi:hypothetical protein LguiA_026919 [Lonicera macranthoides]
MAGNYTVNFSGAAIQVTVADKVAQVNKWVREVRARHNTNGETMIVGLDCEWKPKTIRSMSNKTATMQLCVGTNCLILQMFYVDYLPQSIKCFLSDPRITFVGVEVGDNVIKLRNYYGLRVASKADIQAMAMRHWPNRFYRKPGLKDLAYRVVSLSMPKPKHVCRSNWEARILSLEQVEYACIDAYASYRIGHKLIKEMHLVN